MDITYDYLKADILVELRYKVDNLINKSLTWSSELVFIDSGKLIIIELIFKFI